LKKILRARVEPPRPAAARSVTNVTSTVKPGRSTDRRLTAAQNPNLAYRSPQNAARLVITQGNESGKSSISNPAKTYTVGRGIENDVVLTDIAVSRKHLIFATTTVRGSSSTTAPVTAPSSTATRGTTVHASRAAT